MTLNPNKVRRTPNICYHYSRVPRFTPFRFTTSRFSVTGLFEKSAPNDPQMTLNTTSSNVPNMCNVCPWFPTFIPFRSMASHFSDASNFETSAPNDPQMTLTPTGLKVPPTYSKFYFVSVHDQPCSRYRQFWDKCNEWPQNDIEPDKVKARSYMSLATILRQGPQMTLKLHWTLQGHVWPIYVFLVSASPIFHSVSLYGEHVLKYRPFWDKCTEWPQNGPKHYKVIGTPHMCY